MKNFLAPVVLTIVLAVPGETIACEPTLRDAVSDVTDAQSIIVGYVTGHRHIGYEAHLLAGGSPDTGQVGDVLVRVAPLEALKGKKPAQVIEAVADCMGTYPEDRARVVVIQIGGRNYLIDHLDYEKDLRHVMQHGR